MAEQNPTRTVDAARPTGKRQMEGASTAPARARDSRPARRSEAEEERGSRNPVTFLSQVFSELRKVIWPTGRQMVVYTVVVLLFLIIMVALVWGVDWVAHWGVAEVLTR